MKYIFIITLIAPFSFLLNSAIHKEDIATCKKYITQSETMPNWWISQTDYEMCKHHGIDFSEYLK